jgi:hypothetical protein
MRGKEQFVILKRGNRELKIPAALRRIAAKLEHRSLLFRPDGLENLAVGVTEILPLNESPQRLSDNMSTIQMPPGILAGKL